MSDAMLDSTNLNFTDNRSPILIEITVVLGLVLGLLPLGFYAAMFGGVPVLPPDRTLELLSATDTVVLVDVRPEAAYQERHISGAQSMPLAQIQAVKTALDLPPALQGKTLLLVCDVGVLSARATRHLTGLGLPAYSVRGGMQDWGRAWPRFKDDPASRFVLAGGVIQEPFQAMEPGLQAAAALALLWIKPTYMLLSGIVALYLLLVKAGDLRVLGWGLLVFLIGEVFCAINYIFLQDNSYFAEYMHSYSMALTFGLVIYALMEGVDQRVVHFSHADRQCAMLPVCGPCAKHQAVRCGIRHMAELISITLIVLALIPLLSPFSYTAYNTLIGPVNHYYVRPIVHQWFEARFSPAVAIVLIGLALLVMRLMPRTTLHPLARILFCVGAGYFGFALFRVTLGLIFAESLVWATFWEELTELLSIGAVIYILWTFRLQLLPDLKLPEALN